MIRQTIPELDGIRAVSILLVMATHLLALGPRELGINAAAGALGMSLFFCLSGFLITKFLYERVDVTDFFRRRMARICPLVILYSAIVAILITGRWDAFAAAVLFYINYYDPGLQVPAMSHLWSLAVEAQFYASIGLLVLVFGRKGFWAVPILAVAILVLKISAGPEAYLNIRTHYRVDEILSGSMLALVWLRAPVVSGRVAGICFWLALPVLVLSSHSVSGPLNYARPYLAALTVGSAVFLGDGLTRSVLRTPLLRYIARISYALYVWHPLMALGWLGEGDKATLYLVKRPITFALTFAAAHLSSRTFEAYFQRLAKAPPHQAEGVTKSV